MQEQLIRWLSEVNHFGIELKHILVYAIHSSCQLTRNSSNCIAISSQICVQYSHFFESICFPNCMECHGQSIHAIWTNIAGFIQGPAPRISVVLDFPVPISIFNGLVELTKHFPILFARIVKELNRFLHTLSQEMHTLYFRDKITTSLL